jgi:hypothetical protein
MSKNQFVKPRKFRYNGHGEDDLGCWGEAPGDIIVCTHYEGKDENNVTSYWGGHQDQEWSMDFTDRYACLILEYEIREGTYTEVFEEEEKEKEYMLLRTPRKPESKFKVRACWIGAGNRERKVGTFEEAVSVRDRIYASGHQANYIYQIVEVIPQ